MGPGHNLVAYTVIITLSVTLSLTLDPNRSYAWCSMGPEPLQLSPTVRPSCGYRAVADRPGSLVDTLTLTLSVTADGYQGVVGGLKLGEWLDQF